MHGTLINKASAVSLLCLVNFACLPSLAADRVDTIRLATTTSTTSSGMLDKLLPPFEKETGYTVEVEAYGSGRALRRARDGNADVIIVHSPAAEQKFMSDGFGLDRLPLMRNEFILAGPKSDPAGVASMPGIVDAFKSIARTRALFVSRGDDSGTHNRELDIWNRSSIEPYGKWYIEYGYGMDKTLFYADRMNGYVLVDRSTWLAKRGQIQLVVLSEGEPMLDNPYHIISVSPAAHPSVNHEGSQRLIEWMTSRQGKDIIKSITVDGEQLFILPNQQ